MPTPSYTTPAQADDIKWSRRGAYIAMLGGLLLYAIGFTRIYQGHPAVLSNLLTLSVGTWLIVAAVLLINRASTIWLMALLAKKPGVHIVCITRERDEPGHDMSAVYDKIARKFQ